jgi:hypothetical protein
MRKNSLQILKEIYLDKALYTFPHIEELRRCMNDLLQFKPNELDALNRALELVKDSPELSAWVADQIVEHSRYIMSLLGMTVEGYREFLKLMEDEYIEYTKIRDKARKQVDKSPASKLQ